MLLYYITDRKAFPGTAGQQIEALLRRIHDASRAGVDYIQLREKDLPPRELEALAREAVASTRSACPDNKLLVNSRADVALATGADGVQLPAGELSVGEVRALWANCGTREPLVGVSAHTAAEVQRAQLEGADFAALAPVFEKAQSAASAIGLTALREASMLVRSRANSKRPQRSFALLALGGVTLANARACMQAGADGVAGIRLFQQGDVLDVVQRLRAG